MNKNSIVNLPVNLTLNFVEEYREFVKSFDPKDTEFYSEKEDKNSISDEEYKALCFINHILPKLIKFEDKVNYGRFEYLAVRTEPRVCMGGTCYAEVCWNIGKLTQCDSGCTYGGV